MIAVHGRICPIALRSLARAANVSEHRVFKPLLNFARRRLEWDMTFVIGDRGYVNSRYARFLRQQWNAALIVAPKKNMKPPDGCAADGCPLCPVGERLVWEDYDGASEQLIYRGSHEHCRQCPLAGTCPKQFERDAGANETFWGMVPSHSRLARTILRRLRPRVEVGFNMTKNRYLVKDFFINSRHLAQTLCVLSDIVETLNILAQERPARGQETRKALVADMVQLELWD